MRNETILCFGYAPNWEFWRQDHEVMLLLSKNNKVVYVTKQLGYSEHKVIKKNMGDETLKNAELEWINANLVVVSPPLRFPRGTPIPSAKIKNLYAYMSIIASKKLLKIKIKKVLNKLKLKPTVFWCYDPFDLPMAGHFGEKIKCYRVYDEVSLFPGCKPFKNAVEDMEKKYIKKIDFVFASSRFQYEKRKSLNSNTFFIPNACNFNHFNKVLTNNLSIPEDMKAIPRPIIGFVGKMDNRLDIEIIDLLSVSHPEWSIVFIGWGDKIVTDKIKMNQRSNIYILGAKEFDVIPNYVKDIDVSIIPYILSESTKTMYPWKLHEHLAAGKSIVCTNLPEVKPFENVIRIAKSKEEFVRYVEEELMSNRQEKIEKIVEVARENTWENRIREMEKIIQRK